MTQPTPRTAGRRLPAMLVGAGWIALGLAVLLLGGLAVSPRSAFAPFAFDRWVVSGLRGWGGPGWLRAAAIDVTALGGGTVLTLVTLGAAVLLLARRLWLTAAATVLACWSGGRMVALAKYWFARPRPALADRLVEVSNYSFPSGHAAGSATVYLTLAALATQVTPDPATRRAIVAIAILLVGAIGTSRVYLGVHWPSDVAAGWSFGTLWALGWWRATAAARASIGGER